MHDFERERNHKKLFQGIRLTGGPTCYAALMLEHDRGQRKAPLDLTRRLVRLSKQNGMQA